MSANSKRKIYSTEDSVDNFVSTQAQILWNLFTKTGNINIYRLYFAVQHTKDSTLDKIINGTDKQTNSMEL